MPFRFLENSCTLALGVFELRVIIATCEAVFLGKKNSMSEIGRIVLLLAMCVCISVSRSSLSRTRSAARSGFPAPLFRERGFCNLMSVSLPLHVAEGRALKATTLRFCVYFNIFCR